MTNIVSVCVIGAFRRSPTWGSILEQVNGELADLLTGRLGGERVFQLEETNTFVVSLDVRRSWFRYHQLFADLLKQGPVQELPALGADDSLVDRVRSGLSG